MNHSQGQNHDNFFFVFFGFLFFSFFSFFFSFFDSNLVQATSSFSHSVSPPTPSVQVRLRYRACNNKVSKVLYLKVITYPTRTLISC